MATNKEQETISVVSPSHFTLLVNIPRLTNIIRKHLSHQKLETELAKPHSLLIQGGISFSIGGYVKAKEYCREAIAISKEIGLRQTRSALLLSFRIRSFRRW